MNISFPSLGVIVLVGMLSCSEASDPKQVTDIITEQPTDPVLRHIVVFKFNDDATPEAVDIVNQSFVALQESIPEIKDFEWGVNNSPEGLDQEFTHVYTVTFHSEEGRATYLPHPAHKAFVTSIGSVVEKAFVVDYWTK